LHLNRAVANSAQPTLVGEGEEMKRRESRPITKHTLNLFAGQLDKLQELHPRLGAARVVRQLVENHIIAATAGTAKALEEVPVDVKAVEDIL
jgi:hypothetical protein